jgi:hypothetical protein
MELAADVIDRDGAVVLNEGTPLTRDHLKEFKRHEVGSAWVKAEPPLPFPLEIVKAAEANVSDRWRFVEVATPFVRAVRRRAVHRTAARLAADPSSPKSAGAPA